MPVVPPLSPPAPEAAHARLASAWRLAVVAVLGFASGLPLALTGQAMQTWLSVQGIDLATIGFLSLVGLPYTFKFLWAPLMDRFELPWLGRRRGWLVLSQLVLAVGLFGMASLSPTASTRVFALMAVLVAFVSASHDVVVDAYRTDVLATRERGLGSSMHVMGYRLAMIVSGGLALIWTDTAQGGGWTWPEVYRLMACLMVAAAVFSAIAVPRLPAAQAPQSSGRADVRGFLSVLTAVIAGYLVTDWLLAPASHRLLAPLATGAGMNPALAGKWIDLVALLGGIAVTVPMAMWAARRARFETLIDGLSNYFQQPGAVAILVLIVLYKLCDAFALSLMTPFLLQGMAFSSAEVGVINKVVGLWLTIMGALMGGALMLRLGLWRALFCFGLLQMASNLGFWWLAVHGKGALPGIMLPAFDWFIVRLTQATPVDGGLLLVVALDNLSGGMGTAAFLAFLTSLCNQRFTATQFALLSAFSSIGRVWVGPLAGVLAESVGWPTFFIVSTLVALPALWLLWRLRAEVRALDVPSGPVNADD